MAVKPLKRFYKSVDARPSESAGAFEVALDGKALKTPERSPLYLPNISLARAVAAEWDAQVSHVRHNTMPFTKFSFTAIDRVAPRRADVVAQIAAFGKTDLLCYRSSSPADLVERERAVWDPLLEWSREEYGAPLHTVEGIAFVQQSRETLAALERAVSRENDFALAGLHAAAGLCGSLVIALGLYCDVLNAEAAFAAARLPELYQIGKWGEDWEAKARMDRERRDLQEISRFFGLLAARAS